MLESSIFNINMALRLCQIQYLVPGMQCVTVLILCVYKNYSLMDFKEKYIYGTTRYWSNFIFNFQKKAFLGMTG